MHSRKPWLLVLLLLCSSANAADNAAAARAIVDKAIEAAGGEAELVKYKGFTAKMKGDLVLGEAKIAFSGDVAAQGADQDKAALTLDIAGQTLVIVHVLNKDKGWLKVGDTTMDMSPEQLAEAQEEAHLGWLASLTPLREKSCTLDVVGEFKVGEKSAVAIRVSSAGRRDVNLFFDKQTYFLIKTEGRVKDEMTGEEVTEEKYFSDFDIKNLAAPLKVNITRNGKPFLDATLSDIKYEAKLDDSVFAKP